MDEQQQSRWRRLKAFRLDVEGACFPFSAKLAKENGWSREFTVRVIFEYRRFAFLAAEAGHPVSPSDAVDQAWHLHMLYSASYWKDFCPNVLGMALHHHPSRGGEQESTKFGQWYEQTLTSYHRIFGEFPPTDIWPPKAALHSHHQRVDTTQYWVLPKPTLRLPQLMTLCLVPVLLAMGCESIHRYGINVLDWTGPDFLGFFVIAYGLSLLAALAVRHAMRTPDGTATTAELPTGHEISALVGDHTLAISSAVSALVNDRRVEVLAGRLLALPNVTEPEDPLEASLLNVIRHTPNPSLWHLRSGALLELAQQDQRLRLKGLLLSRSVGSQIGMVAFLLASVIPVLGVMKIMVGMMRDRPVSVLVLLCLVAVIVNVVVLLKSPRRTLKADHTLAFLRQARRGLRDLGLRKTAIPTAELVEGVALFGLIALHGDAYQSLHSYLSHAQQSAPPGSDGGGGCGGGGGGCGGGCGGCGGCGGG